jgi:hypothetical protein
VEKLVHCRKPPTNFFWVSKTIIVEKIIVGVASRPLLFSVQEDAGEAARFDGTGGQIPRPPEQDGGQRAKIET